MNIERALQSMEEDIAGLEKEQYYFETVVKTRAQNDKKILEKMRSDYVKLGTVQEKIKKGEKITDEEMISLVPEAFR